MAKDPEYIPKILDPDDFADGGLAPLLGEPTYADGGRIGFKLGGIDKARRAFLKWAGVGAAGVGAAKSGLLGLLKSGKPITGVVTSVPIKSGVDGMPAWFKPLVNKVIKEGTEVPSGAERVIVHKTKLPDSKTDIYVEQDLNTGNVVVDIGVGKHGFSAGYHGQPVRLEYKASEVIEPNPAGSGFITSKGQVTSTGISKGKMTDKGMKTKEEFWVEEAEFTGGHPENIKFEESTFEKFGEHGSDFSEVEKFATGKVTKSSKGKKEVWEADWDDSLPDDYASGGRVPFVKGKLAKYATPEGLAALIEKLFPGTTKVGQTSRPMAEKTQLRRAIAGFQEREKAAKSKIIDHSGDAPKAGEGRFTKAEAIIMRLENTIKGAKGKKDKESKYVLETFPNFIKEIKAKPELANNQNVWDNIMGELPKDQQFVVYGDDTVDFFTQSKFGPHNIASKEAFHRKHPYLTKQEAIKISKMEPTDQVMELKRLETIRRTKHASGGIAGGRVGLLWGGGIFKTIIQNLAKAKGVTPSDYLKITNYKALPREVRNLMSKEDFEKMKAGRIEMFENWVEMAKTRKEFLKNIEQGKKTPAAPIFEHLEKSFKSSVPSGVTDKDILQGEFILKNLKTKGRKLNAEGGLAGMLGE